MASLYLDGVRIQTSNIVLYEKASKRHSTTGFDSDSCLGMQTRHLEPSQVQEPTGCTKTVFMYPCKRESIHGKRVNVVLTDEGVTTRLRVKQGCCIKKLCKAESREKMLPLRWEVAEGSDRRIFELDEEEEGGCSSRVSRGSLHCEASTHEWLGIVVENTTDDCLHDDCMRLG
jgi:hypothetical protein